MLTTNSKSISESRFVPKPEWLRSPKTFWAVHRAIIQIKLHESEQVNPNISLEKFILKYLEGLPKNLPLDVLPKIKQLIIEVWEQKHATAEPENWQSHPVLEEVAA